MARKDAKKTVRVNKINSKNVLIAIAILFALPFSMPTIILVLCGMLPSIAAYASDAERNKRSLTCIASMNFAGLCSWLVDLWFSNHDLNTAMHMAMNLKMISFSYGGAAIGWFFYQLIPSFYLVYQARQDSKLITGLVEKQDKLVEIWGEGIKTSHR